MSPRKEAQSRLKLNGMGYWERDPLTMEFCGEPTSDGDQEAYYMREWYEANRERWWDRHGLDQDTADNFMLSLMDQATIISDARKAFFTKSV